MILRIIDKETNLFLRDDFSFDEQTEIGLNVKPAEGLYNPLWNGSEWIEGASQEYIDSIKAEHVPTIEERIEALELLELERLFGGA